MSLMNLNFGVLVFEDRQNIESPQVRTPDISRTYQHVPVANAKSEEVTLHPGEMTTVAATLRSLGLDNTTELELLRPIATEEVIRLRWTGVGTNPLFRTKRALGIDATTVVSMSRVAPNTVRITSVGGTAINSAAVQVGDILKFERSTDAFTTVFSPSNVGQYFRVQAKGAAYIEFLDNGASTIDTNKTLGADFDMQMRVLSQGPVRVGDNLQLQGSGINAGNLGKSVISDLSSDYVEFVNAFAVAETFTNTNNVVIYDQLIGFLLARSPYGAFKLSINGQEMTVSTLSGEALFMGSVQAHTVEALNEGLEPITLFLLRATVC